MEQINVGGPWHADQSCARAPPGARQTMHQFRKSNCALWSVRGAMSLLRKRLDCKARLPCRCSSRAFPHSSRDKIQLEGLWDWDRGDAGRLGQEFAKRPKLREPHSIVFHYGGVVDGSKHIYGHTRSEVNVFELVGVLLRLSIILVVRVHDHRQERRCVLGVFANRRISSMQGRRASR
jgi:hypothetical protein